MMAQMGDMLGQANEQLKELRQSGDRDRLLAEGIAGEGVIIAHGVPARGAQWFNMDIDMEIHVPGRKPYQVNNQYMVPNGATLGPGVRLPVKVDPEDPAKIAIDWDSAGRAPARGEVRPAAGACRLSRGARGQPLGRRRRLRSRSSSGWRSCRSPARSPTPSSSSRRRGSSAASEAPAARRVPLVGGVPLLGAGARRPARGDGRGWARPGARSSYARSRPRPTLSA